jgi:hypothetical protein
MPKSVLKRPSRLVMWKAMRLHTWQSLHFFNTKKIYIFKFVRLYDDQGDSLNAAKAYEAYLTLYTEELVRNQKMKI